MGEAFGNLFLCVRNKEIEHITVVRCKELLANTDAIPANEKLATVLECLASAYALNDIIALEECTQELKDESSHLSCFNSTLLQHADNYRKETNWQCEDLTIKIVTNVLNSLRREFNFNDTYCQDRLKMFINMLDTE